LNKKDKFEEEILDYIAKFFNMNKKDINQNTKINDFSNWDSIAHVNIILGLEKKYKVKIPAKKYFELESIKKIIKFLNEKNS
tara:strand:- start:255 stop:500 length:246 start_codon:yes stop_codon:yes gene_type:complete